MTKSVQLKLSKIKYGGDSIGDDIRVEVETLGKFLSVDKRIKDGEVAEINKEVGRFETDSKSFYADVSIIVIETKHWMEIYNILIKARKDSISVGVLEVID